MTAKTGKLDDPEWRRERARKAALARNSVGARIAALERDIDNITGEDVTRLTELTRKVRARVRKTHITRVAHFTEKDAIPHIEGQRTIDDQLRENRLHKNAGSM